MTVELIVHFGNSNWFHLAIADRIKFATLFEMISFITNIPVTEFLYIICNGHLVGSSDEHYGFGSIINDIPELELQDNKMTVHVITRNRKVKDDKYDLVMANRLHRFVRRPVITARAPDDTTAPPTVISRTSAAPPTIAQLLNGGTGGGGGGSGGGSADTITNLFAAMLNGAEITYDEALNLRDVPVVISTDAFNRLTTIVDRTSLSADDLAANCFCGSSINDEAMGGTLTQLPCRHNFHTECIKHHLTSINPRCPICNGDVRGE